MRIKAILFDLWSTILKRESISSKFMQHFDIKKYKGYIKDYEEAIQLQSWPSKNAMINGLLKYFNVDATKENVKAVIKMYNESIKNVSLNDGMEEILIELHKNYKLAIVTNTTDFDLVVIKKCGIEKYFDAITCSCQVGFLKPSKKIFQVATSELGVKLRECLLVDDAKLNVDKARSYGMQAIKFKDAKQLRNELKRLDLKLGKN